MTDLGRLLIDAYKLMRHLVDGYDWFSNEHMEKTLDAIIATCQEAKAAIRGQDELCRSTE